MANGVVLASGSFCVSATTGVFVGVGIKVGVAGIGSFTGVEMAGLVFSRVGGIVA